MNESKQPVEDLFEWNPAEILGRDIISTVVLSASKVMHR